MTEEEFLKPVKDFVHGHLCHSDNWRYHCFNMVTEKCKDSGRMEIVIQYSPYRIETGGRNDAQ